MSLLNTVEPAAQRSPPPPLTNSWDLAVRLVRRTTMGLSQNMSTITSVIMPASSGQNLSKAYFGRDEKAGLVPTN